ncbi:hypothetical protein ES703_90145 [subsurface metagenome]
MHPFPCRYAEIFGLLEAGDQKIGDGLLQVVIGFFPGLVLEADHSNGSFRDLFLGKQKQHNHNRNNNSQNRQDWNKQLLCAEGNGYLFRSDGLPLGNYPLRSGHAFFYRFQLCSHFPSALISFFSILFQTFQDYEAEILRNLGIELSWILRRLTLMFHRDGDRSLTFKRQPAGHHLIQNHS